ncbi:MAG: DNA adenine methylase [Gillisia sp.]
MNYIGSKNKLTGFIKSKVHETVGTDLSDKIFCDLFAGTGMVGRSFKTEVKSIIANDVEYYSFVLNKNYIENTSLFEYQQFIEELNALDGIHGFISENYSEGGKAGRLYFSEENGKKIDAARIQIEKWKKNKEIDENIYYFLLCSLLESADKVANTASVYGAYLKNIKSSAAKPLKILPALFEDTSRAHKVYNRDANSLINKLKGDILYLDPPYNARQYGANYHILNTIAKYDTFAPKGKTGLPDYFKSSYCSKNNVRESLENLLKNADFNYVFLSYNNEGLLLPQEIKELMKRYGSYELATKKYQRFKADKTENRNHTASETIEYLHILNKK